MPDYIVAAADYRLRPESPCVDSSAIGETAAGDIEGGGRPCGDGVDMGAFELGGCPAPLDFRRGDANADGAINVADSVAILLFLTSGVRGVPCHRAADLDDSGGVGLTDAVVGLTHLFLAGPPPREPFPSCGPDPTSDRLTCEAFEGCR